MLSKNHYAVIMAGGIGSRFWPYSRNQRPKQFLDILGTGKSLLQMTYDRLARLIEPENILIISHVDYRSLVARQLPDLPASNMIFEPERKNTAPCTALAAKVILDRDPEAYILTAPADHLILNEHEFIEDIREGFEFLADKDVLLTLGIQASRPDTGYGYIQFSEEPGENSSIFKVLRFVEKPDHNTAMEYLRAGHYAWNSGMFLWKAATIWDELREHAPDILASFEKINTQDLQPNYAACRNISIDYAIMEKSSKVYVRKVDFGWSDLGTWGSLHTILPQDEHSNASKGEKSLFYEVERSIIYNQTGQIMVLQGLQDFIVVNTQDALLICQKSEEQRIKQMLADVEKNFGKDAV